ncbi:MAG: 30S ribosomal protein S6 [Acidobacteriales bacterium]|nr:30S ribosomal protein S6 [Terriglobales bacterium]
MIRKYEVMFIVRPDIADEEVEKLISTFQSNVTAAGGKVLNAERMGKRRLAYIVRGFGEGNYVLLGVEGTGAVIHELERRLRVSEPVIKFLSVRTDEQEKRHAKIKKLREARVKRSPGSAPAAEEAGSEPAAASV